MLTLLASIAAATLVDSGRRQAQRPKAFQLWATCPDFSSGEIIHYLNEHATEVTYATFARWADLSQLRAEGHPAMYRVSAPDNWAISFWRSQLPTGQRVYYFAWSRIEHIFLDPEEGWPDREKVAQLARVAQLEGPSFGASSLASAAPAEVLQLRRQGVSSVAEAVGRRPGRARGLRSPREALQLVQALWPAGEPDAAYWLPTLAAVAWVESEGDTLAVSSTGALGLMQLTSFVWAPEADPRSPNPGPRAINPFDPQAAMLRAHELLDQLLGRAARGDGPAGLDPELVMLGAYKEGWRGFTTDEARRRRGLDYARKVLAVRGELRG